MGHLDLEVRLWRAQVQCRPSRRYKDRLQLKVPQTCARGYQKRSIDNLASLCIEADVLGPVLEVAAYGLGLGYALNVSGRGRVLVASSDDWNVSQGLGV